MKLGKNKLVLIGVAGLIVILTIGGLLLTSINKKKALKADSSETQGVTDGALVFDDEPDTVWFFNKEVYDNWSVPVPIINPMGEESSYQLLEYKEDDSLSLDYYSNDLYPTSRLSYGRLWRFEMEKVPNAKDEDYSFYMRDFERYLIDMGGKKEGYLTSGIIFVIETPEGVQWWGTIEEENEFFAIELVEERSLLAGKTLTINTADHPNQEIFFTTYNTQGEFSSAEVKIPKGRANISISQKMTYEPYTRYQSYDTLLDYEKEDYYRLNDLPLDQTNSIWKVNWYDDPGTIEIKLNSIGNLVPIESNDNLGALVISAQLAHHIKLFPDGIGSYVDHPEYTENMQIDRTEDGDFIVYLPSGMWRAELAPQVGSLVSKYCTQFIPVQAGHMTRVEMPYLLEKALQSNANNEISTSGLRIDEVIDLDSTVEVEFTLVDSQAKDVLPTIENTTVFESSEAVNLIDITPVKTPPSVALLIDSSGSMKGQMEATLKAAKEFIEGLPDGTYLRVIDFDTDVRVMEGETKAQGVESLKKISVGGYTALFDGVMEGMELLQDKARPTLVVFTDGENELPKEKITPDMTTQEDVINCVNNEDIQILTIGFGKEHDGTVLKSISKAGRGLYFNAEDQMALKKAFDAINEKIHSTFVATYERPTQIAPSDVPFVNIVLDVSASMDMAPDDDCGYRMEKMKNLFHDFITELPENTQMQLMSFNDQVVVNQMMTPDKLKILRALGMLRSGGGTVIMDSVKAGYQSLAAIPSSKKVLIYLTDAALNVSSDEQESFEAMLKEMAEEGVHVLWVGLGEGLKEEDFRLAAELSKGACAITEDSSELKKAIDTLMNSVEKEPKNKLSTLSVRVVKEEENGKITPFSASALAELKPLPLSGKVELKDAVRYEVGIPFDQYNANTAKFLTGDQLPKEAVKITKRLELDRSRQNSAMSISAKELLFLSEFNGVKAPSESRFAALFVELNHILPEQQVTIYPDGSGHPASWMSSNPKGQTTTAKVPYVIPNAFNHLALSFNNYSVHPLSTATWIAEKPLVAPGENAIELLPDKPIEGVIVFTVPSEPMEQLSLHFYDVDYGHIHLPVIGKMSGHMEGIEDLPQDVGVELHKGFSLSVGEVEDVKSLGNQVQVNENNVFKLVKGRIQTLVQANLALNPKERIHLLSHTSCGNFYLPIHDATELIPFGMLSETMVSPGANNRASFAFLMPERLAGNKASLFVDLVDEDVLVPTQDGEIYDTGTPLATAAHDYFDVSVNKLFRLGEEGKEELVIADLTIYDHKDGFASRGITDLFRLVHKDHTIEELLVEQEAESTYEKRMEMALNCSGLSGFASLKYPTSTLLIEPDSLTSSLVLGFDSEAIVYDGTSRRGLIAFRAPLDEVYTLQSSLFKDLNIPISKSQNYLDYLSEHLDIEVDNTYTESLSLAIERAIARFAAQRDELSLAAKTLESLDPNAVVKQQVDVPSAVLYGHQKWQAVDSLEALEKLLRSVKVIYEPNSQNSSPYTYTHSPEAIITQGWGTIEDLTHAAIRGLSRLGYPTKRFVVGLNNRGKDVIGSFLDCKDHNLYNLPAISFKAEGKDIVWLMPYMKDFSECSSHGGFVMDYDTTMTSKSIPITVAYLIEPNGNSASDKSADAASALSGSDAPAGPYWKNVLNDSMELADLSLGCFDLGTTIVEGGYTPIITTQENTYKGNVSINPDKYNILGIKIEIGLSDNPLKHVTIFPDNVGPDACFITIGANLPNFVDGAYNVFANAAESIHEQVENPNVISSLKWFARSGIMKYQGLQDAFEKKLAETYDLTIAHISSDQAVVLTQMVYNGKHIAQMDLLNPVTKTIQHAELSDQERLYQNSYYTMSGLHASIAESKAIQGGVGLLEIWSKLPENTDFIVIPPVTNVEVERERLKKMGMTDSMVDRFDYYDRLIVVPSSPVKMYGRDRWAWLEFNPHSYEVISVLDDFTHGSMVESSIIEALKNGAQYLVGVFVGVDVSLWSMAGFSLEIDEYEDIRKMAQEYALSLKQFFGVSKGPVGVDIGGNEASLGIGPIKGTIGHSGLDWEKNLKENVLGFTNGYEEGVMIYFDVTK